MITIGHTLPQGSPASSILAFGFLKPALEDFQRRFENRVVVVNYCDNFIILAPGPISLRAAMEYLSLVLKKHSADRFVLEQKSGPRRMSDGIDFVGHHFKRRKGCPVVNIPTIKKREFAHDLKAKLSEIKGPSSRVVCDRDARLDHLAKWLRGKLASFSMAPEAQFAAMWRARILTRYSMNAEIADLLRWIVRKAPDCSVPVRRRNACPTGIPRNFRASEVRLDAAVANAAREFTYRYLSKVRATVAAKEAYPC